MDAGPGGRCLAGALPGPLAGALAGSMTGSMTGSRAAARRLSWSLRARLRRFSLKSLMLSGIGRFCSDSIASRMTPWRNSRARIFRSDMFCSRTWLSGASDAAWRTYDTEPTPGTPDAVRHRVRAAIRYRTPEGPGPH